MILNGCIFKVAWGLILWWLELLTMLVFVMNAWFEGLVIVILFELVILLALVMLLLLWKKWRFRLFEEVEGLLVLFENPVLVWVLAKEFIPLIGDANYRLSDFFMLPR